MSRFLSPAEERPRRWPIVAALAVGAVSVAAAVISDMRERSHQIAQSDADAGLSRIVGPPCPTVARGAFAQPLRPDKVFEFNSVDFASHFGHVDCGVASARDALGQGFYPVCQFSSPAVLAIGTAGKVFYFEPGLGRAATVSVRGGVARCVLASPYWAAYMRAVTQTDANGKPLPAKPG